MNVPVSATLGRICMFLSDKVVHTHITCANICAYVFMCTLQIKCFFIDMRSIFRHIICTVIEFHR